MPVLLHPSMKTFPPLREASPEGLLAVGGDLSLERLLTAYANGIFPWYDEDTPILWWAPPERCMLHPWELHVPRSLRKTIGRRCFAVTLDTAFPSVIRSCAASPRPGQNGTWIVPEMAAAYTALHAAGYAHSVEAWLDGELAGGLYGVALGGGFFGESMFHRVPEASKVCFVWLARLLDFWGFTLIDCQQVTRHMVRFGAYAVARDAFMPHLDEALRVPVPAGKWRMPEGFFPF